MNVERATAAARAALEKYHYKDTCTVIELRDQKDPKTKITRKEEVTVLENLACKLSFETIKSAENSDTVAAISVIAKLFIPPEITIAPGSKIVVTHEGTVEEYQQSGIPAVFPTHREIMLTAFVKWA